MIQIMTMNKVSIGMLAYLIYLFLRKTMQKFKSKTLITFKLISFLQTLIVFELLT